MFVQIDFAVIERIATLKDGFALAVYVALKRHANITTGLDCWVSDSAVAKEAGVSAATVWRKRTEAKSYRFAGLAKPRHG